MNNKDREAVAEFKKNHLLGIPAILKGTGSLTPALHIYGRKKDGYGIIIMPMPQRGDIPIDILRGAVDKMFDEMLCLSFSAEATLWKGSASKFDENKIDDYRKEDEVIKELKASAKPVDILWITFEDETGSTTTVYEVRRTGSMVTAYGDLAPDVQLIELKEDDRPDAIGGRFANIFRKIKNKQ